jgi:molybdate transport system substrate-binding protein
LLKAKFLTNKLSLVIVLLLGLAACNSQESGSRETDASGSGRLVIFSAASLTEAFTELAQTFKLDHPEVENNHN